MRRASGVEALVVHASYLINLATSDDALRRRSEALLGATLEAASALGAAGVVVHVGAQRGADPTSARVALVATIRRVLARSHVAVPLILENSASALFGQRPRDLGAIVDEVRDERLGVCIDTQHLFAAGIDLRDDRARTELVREIDELGPLLALWHVNDSASPCGSRRDHHANVGHGEIGQAAIVALMSEVGRTEADAVLEVPGDGGGPRLDYVLALRAALGSLGDGTRL